MVRENASETKLKGKYRSTLILRGLSSIQCYFDIFLTRKKRIVAISTNIANLEKAPIEFGGPSFELNLII